MFYCEKPTDKRGESTTEAKRKRYRCSNFILNEYYRRLYCYEKEIHVISNVNAMRTAGSGFMRR